MKNYYRIMLGQRSVYVKEAHDGGFIGAGWLGEIDLTNNIPDNWREFNKKYIPLYLEKHPDKSKVSAGLACGMLHTIIKGINENDIVLCPDGEGNYLVGEVTSGYVYAKGEVLPHRRKIHWYTDKLPRSEMSEALQNSTGAIGTVSNVSKYEEELEALIAGKRPPTVVATDESIEDPSVFALETHLEEFLVQNWEHTELGEKYKIYEEDGEIVGQQFPTDTGPIDILAISKDDKELLVVELKKGRASDLVVGQIQRYMGYVKEELAEENQKVHGVIIAFEDDLKIQRALSITQNIGFYTYTVKFTLNRKK
jgi:restriction system protein